ncbi:hypothetical protein ACLKA6_001102 [Drosophila palustris]
MTYHDQKVHQERLQRPRGSAHKKFPHRPPRNRGSNRAFFAQIAKERVLIGVLDRGNPDGRIPRSQWKWVESALAAQCFQLLEKEPGPPPVCKDVGWYQGNVKVIACDDNRSADLYKAAVATVGEVYQGAKLAAVDWEEIPVRPRARMWIPSTIKEPEQLLKMLQRCNPSLPTHDWRVAKIEETPGPTHQAVIILNKESLAPIDAAGGELNFGFSSVFIRVYKSDAAVSGVPSDKPVMEDIAAELEAPERPEMDGYISDASSLTRDLRKLWQTGDLEVTSNIASDDEDANVTVVKGHSSILLNKDSIPPKTDYCMPTEHMITPFRTLIPRREEWAFEPPGTINIYSDSQAAIKSIAATTTKSLSVLKCRKSLHEMAEHFDICLIWVPGHQDIPGNCIADELARQGTTEILLPDKEDISMPLATCKLMLHTQSNLKSTLCWQNSLVGRVARQTWPHIDKARTDALCNLSRVECSFVIRSLTGHWLIGIHAQRMNSPYNDFCRSCRDEEEEESPEHFCSCPALMSRRLHTLGKSFLDGLGDLADKPPRKIAQFVQSSNWTPF